MKLLLAGFGTVGSGVAKALDSKKDAIKSKLGGNLSVVGICTSKGTIIDEKGIDLPLAYSLAQEKKLYTHRNFDPNTSSEKAVKTLEYDCLVETTPTNIDHGEPGATLVRTALRRQKHVVTSNKGPLALNFRELTGLAEKNNVLLKYEATVGGAMPVFNLLEGCMHVNKIEKIYGILNGTTNYILSKMSMESTSYELALAEAQEMGIAEKDPSYDVEGTDAASKLSILSNFVFGNGVTVRDVQKTGITKISGGTIELAKKNGYIIKLVAYADAERMLVTPRLVPLHHPLAIDGTLNVIEFHTDMAGKIRVIGEGAGHMQTASAVLGDILDIAKSTK